MKKISIVLKSLFIGSLLFYVYNYVYYKKEYEVLTKEIYNNLNIFLLIAVCSLILIVIIYVVNNINKKTINVQQISFDLEKKQYEIPKERQMSCSNCNNIIDKNAYICLYCGSLLKKNKQDYSSIFIIFIILILCVFIFSYKNTNETDNTSLFFNNAKDIIEILNNKEIKTNKDKVYFTLEELNINEDNINSRVSYFLINKTENKKYLSIVGKNSYENYSIEVEEINQINKDDVLINTSTIREINKKLIISNKNNVTIYNKN